MPPDCIQINDLSVECIIGVDDWERQNKQQVLIDLELRLPLGSAGQSDNLTQTIDYRDLAQFVVAEMSQTQFKLLEAFADCVAALCLRRFSSIQSIGVRVRKPMALNEMGDAKVAVQIDRARTWLLWRNLLRAGAPPA